MVLDQQDVEEARAIVRAHSIPVTVHNSISAHFNWTGSFEPAGAAQSNNSSIGFYPNRSDYEDAVYHSGAAQSNNSTPKIEVHEAPPVRLVRLDD